MSEDFDRATYQRTLGFCEIAGRPHGWREHVVGTSPGGRDIIDAVCPHCGRRVARREVVHNREGEQYAE
ncbi:hypothetical protein [Halobaculum sp. D14]|uniref:hypothetical protein n=1 Tax=Halobaculum sp. D14 TaxID=3421642 RepID=UPI003EB6D420